MEYNVGDKVLIVDKWVEEDGRQNHDGEMDKWLGKVMTVKSRNDTYAYMEEDQDDENCFDGGWFWYPEMIAGKFEKTNDYKPGDKVLIVSEWNDKTNQSCLGGMDEWLGKIVTIDSIDGPFWRIKEDSCWVWNEHCIVGKLRPSENSEKKPQENPSATFKGFWGKSKQYDRIAYIYGECEYYVGYTPGLSLGHNGKKSGTVYDPCFTRPDDISSWFYGKEDISPVEWRVISREPRKGDFVRLKANSPFSFSKKGQIMLVSNTSGRCAQVAVKDHIGFKVSSPNGTNYWSYLFSLVEVIEPILVEEETPNASNFTMFYAYDANAKKLCIVYGENSYGDYLVYYIDRNEAGHDGCDIAHNRDPKAVIPPDSSHWVDKKDIHHIYFTTSSDKPAVGDYIITDGGNWSFNYKNQLLKVSSVDCNYGVKVKDHYARTSELVDDDPDYIWWYFPSTSKRVEAIYDSITNVCVWSRKSPIVQECICVKSAPGLSVGTIYRVSDGIYVDDNGNNRDDASIYLKKKI